MLPESAAAREDGGVGYLRFALALLLQLVTSREVSYKGFPDELHTYLALGRNNW